MVNYLSLNVSTSKEMMGYINKGTRSHSLISIHGRGPQLLQFPMDAALRRPTLDPQYRGLLKKRTPLLSKGLGRWGLSTLTLRNSYRSIIECVLTGVIQVWGGNRTAQDREAIQSHCQ